MPGFTAQSQVPRMFAATGMSFDALLDLLVRDALPVDRGVTVAMVPGACSLDDRMSETGWRPWLPEAIAALIVLAIGFAEALLTWAMTSVRPSSRPRGSCSRSSLASRSRSGCAAGRPARRWSLVWAVWACPRCASGAPIMLIEFALTAVFFGGARWGRPPTVVISALSVPLRRGRGVRPARGPASSVLRPPAGRIEARRLIRQEPTAAAGPVADRAAGRSPLPWPAGLVVRFLDRAQHLAGLNAGRGGGRRRGPARDGACPRDRASARSADPAWPVTSTMSSATRSR